jgi:hypothetical protein
MMISPPLARIAQDQFGIQQSAGKLGAPKRIFQSVGRYEARTRLPPAQLLSEIHVNTTASPKP